MVVKDFQDVEAQPSEGVEGVTIRWVIAKQDGAPHFALRVIEVRPGCATPHHQHEWEHEVFVLAGRGAVKGDGGEQPLREGSVVLVPGNELHQFINTGEDVLRFICLIPNR